MQVDSYFFFKCVLPENIHTSHMEGCWKFQGGRGLEVQISKGCRVIYFQRVQEHCLRETYQYYIYDLINQEIDELQYILVYTNAICTFKARLHYTRILVRHG